MERAAQLNESLARGREIAVLQGLADCIKVLLALADRESIAVGERAALPQGLDRAVFLLGRVKVPRL